MAAILIVSISSCTVTTSKDSAKSEIQGTWEMVSYKYGGDSVLLPNHGKHIKIITDTTFCWVDVGNPLSLVTDAAGGTYSLSGNNYIEYIEYGGREMLPYVGKEQKFVVTIKNDTLHLKGSLSTGEKIEEIWAKLYTN